MRKQTADVLEWLIFDFWKYIAALVGVTFVLALCGLVFYVLGYGLGLWGVGCQLESSQPKCVAAGWNGQTIHLEGKAYKVVPK